MSPEELNVPVALAVKMDTISQTVAALTVRIVISSSCSLPMCERFSVTIVSSSVPLHSPHSHCFLPGLSDYSHVRHVWVFKKTREKCFPPAADVWQIFNVSVFLSMIRSFLLFLHCAAPAAEVEKEKRSRNAGCLKCRGEKKLVETLLSPSLSLRQCVPTYFPPILLPTPRSPSFSQSLPANHSLPTASTIHTHAHKFSQWHALLFPLLSIFAMLFSIQWWFDGRE